MQCVSMCARIEFICRTAYIFDIIAATKEVMSRRRAERNINLPEFRLQHCLISRSYCFPKQISTPKSIIIVIDIPPREENYFQHEEKTAYKYWWLKLGTNLMLLFINFLDKMPIIKKKKLSFKYLFVEHFRDAWAWFLPPHLPSRTSLPPTGRLFVWVQGSVGSTRSSLVISGFHVCYEKWKL